MAASRGASTPFLRIPRRLVSCRSLSSRAPSSASSSQRQLAKREEREREGRIMNLQIAPSWMTKNTLDESRSDY
jgi:hypothetical protein